MHGGRSMDVHGRGSHDIVAAGQAELGGGLKFQDVDALQSELDHSRYDTTRRYIHRTLEERVEMVKALD
ncbi:MAG: hypothetical protein ACE1Z4_08390 [Gammaproteobacteria bacterium]